MQKDSEATITIESLITCEHGFAPEDGCFACLEIDSFDWVTPEHLAIVEREARTGDIPVA